MINPFTGQELVGNSFCPTGAGGGIDPTCGKSGGSSGGGSEVRWVSQDSFEGKVFKTVEEAEAEAAKHEGAKVVRDAGGALVVRSKEGKELAAPKVSKPKVEIPTASKTEISSGVKSLKTKGTVTLDYGDSKGHVRYSSKEGGWVMDVGSERLFLEGVKKGDFKEAMKAAIAAGGNKFKVKK